MPDLFNFIHRVWQATAPLTRVVPSERLYTDVALEPVSLPYVVLVAGESETLQTTSSGTTLARAEIAFHLWADNVQTLNDLSNAIRARFDRAEAKLEHAQLLDLRCKQQTGAHHTEDHWQMRLFFTALLE